MKTRISTIETEESRDINKIMEKEYRVNIKISGKKSLNALRDLLRSLGSLTSKKHGHIKDNLEWEWKFIDSRKAKTELKSKLRYETAN